MTPSCPRLACFCATLGIPLAALAQTATVSSSPPSIAPPQSLTKTLEAASPDRASRLDGRLFFTPQERQRMDDARKRGFVPGDDGEIAEPPSSVLNGFVKRSDGHTAVWVDGVPRWDAKSKAADGLLPTDVGGPAAYLKVPSGESMETSQKRAVRPKVTAKRATKKRSNPRLRP